MYKWILHQQPCKKLLTVFLQSSSTISILEFYIHKMSQFMRFWYLSHLWPAEAQTRQHIYAVSSDF